MVTDLFRSSPEDPDREFRYESMDTPDVDQQAEFFFEHGYAVLPGAVPPPLLAEMQAAGKTITHNSISQIVNKVSKAKPSPKKGAGGAEGA